MLVKGPSLTPYFYICSVWFFFWFFYYFDYFAVRYLQVNIGDEKIQFIPQYLSHHLCENKLPLIEAFSSKKAATRTANLCQHVVVFTEKAFYDGTMNHLLFIQVSRLMDEHAEKG